MIASNLTIAATVTAHGSRPLVLVAMGTLTVTGRVDVSSHRSVVGAAANDASCASTNGGLPQGVGASTSGGGAGGSFGTAGGAGGPPGGSGSDVAPQAAIDGSQLTLLRGGCPGGTGGQDHTGDIAPGGASGGVVYLMATTRILVQGGKVLANGAGGAGGVSSSPADFPGGAGGGAGGLIMFDAPLIDLETATVTANGGGGGGGQGDNASAGQPGMDPDPVAPFVGAGGGAGCTMGGTGGIGSSLAMPGTGGSPGAVSGAAGGGGGGAGVIRTFGTATTPGSKIAPLPS